MRETTSRHNESLRAMPYYYFGRPGARFGSHPNEESFRPAMQVQELVSLLQIPISNASEANVSTRNGKKRATSPTPLPPVKVQKRAKASATGRKTNGKEDEPSSWAEMCYPELKTPVESAAPHDGIPVFKHTFEINYNDHIPSGPMPRHFAIDKDLEDWPGDERKLEETLQILGSLSESPRVDLGTIALAVHSGRVVVVSEVLQKRNDETEWLFLLPTLHDELDFESLGVTIERYSEANHDIFVACHDLQRAGRIAIDGHLTLIILPEEENGYFPFTLQVQLTVSLTPSIYEPLRVPRTRVGSPLEDAQRRLLEFLYPDTALLPDSDAVTNIPFFYSILGPAPHLQHPTADHAMQPEALLPTLLPFQRRSVAWLLDREGKMVTPNGEIVDKPADGINFSFWERIDEGNEVFFVNRLSGNLSQTAPQEEVALGAILAEEPGLGKTLEIISLLLLNPASPDRHPGVKRWDPEANVEVKAVKTTLIVTPPALASQWIDELKLHAPSLKVLIYEGWNKLQVPISAADVEKERIRRLRAVSRGKGKGKGKGVSKRTAAKGKRKYSDDDDESDDDKDDLDEDEAGEDVGEIVDWCSYVQGYDVVVTTYQTLKTDVNVARAAPPRPRREDVVYSNVERPRSPLILVEWNRVVMDEVQMVGGGQVEDMVSLIPRLASFAVSGTPARTQIADLIHVLRFLRVNHLIGSPRYWARLAIPGYSRHFSTFFQNIAVRTTKASVTDELTIPQQTRYLVGIEMGAVERHVYDQMLEEILLQLGLDARGVDVRGENRVPDATVLRPALRKLRAICTHPQVGQAGNKLFKPGALKSMEQVLQTMCDENWGTVVDDCKAKIQGLIRMAQLQQHGADKNRYQHCLETLLLAEKEATRLIEEIESAIATHEANSDFHHAQEPEEEASKKNDKGKGKERERSSSPLSDLGSEEEDDDTDDIALKEYRTKRRVLKQRLRDGKLVMHRVKFLQGDAYHMLGASQLAAENAAYAEAETIRRAILKTSEKEAIDAMNLLAREATSKGLTEEQLQTPLPFLDYELKYAEPQDEVNNMIEDVLNPQCALLWEWRGRLTDLLTKSLTPGEDADVDGQEYQQSLDAQGEAETYLINYTALLADRREALLKERTLLAAHDAREKKSRRTKAANKAAAALSIVEDLPMVERLDDAELAPEIQVLQTELSEQRKLLREGLNERAIKSALVDMVSKIARIHKDEDPEKLALKDAVADLRRFITDQGHLLDQLDADLASYRKAFNQRILYFRQLQEISDAVADVEFEGTAAHALLECANQQRDLAAKINTNRARQRYLDHLSKDKVSGEKDEDEETCILCKCDFIRGFITECAHVFCEDCMKAWVAKRQGSTCPVCRVAINTDKLERFVVAEPAPQPFAEGAPEPVPKSRREIEYNMIDPRTFREIQTMPSFGDYGNKIQTLVRHLSYLRNADPGAKSIIFSAWADSLYIVERALRENGISCLRIDQNRKGLTAVKKFASSEDIDVLLLHGERENAGLNITCASRVFLLESVVHHGFEIQGTIVLTIRIRIDCKCFLLAIARIDRMGQKRPTEVYCYYAEDTIEKNILDLAARQGTSLYTKANSVGSILNVSSLAGDGERKVIDSPVKKLQKGDFIFRLEDMLQILFPHLFEDTEYLISENDSDVVMTDAAPSAPANAVAGPSRLN
ncbi:SNF2 family N-terminal domain-containing protein [Mycena metata]|uniref:SNF2 family N-terminal domain-containing protein n=1 Tax=Mycena metata TaxID=1033252 RepID=A0AAD7IJD2_9AGAR|nr:SNF2 family N-terminal domain-containing protein [Mycena metata]